MSQLPKDHPEVVSLLEQLQAQYEDIGKVPTSVGYLNIDTLRSELFIRGWNTQLAEDHKTVLLWREEEEEVGTHRRRALQYLHGEARKIEGEED